MCLSPRFDYGDNISNFEKSHFWDGQVVFGSVGKPLGRLKFRFLHEQRLYARAKKIFVGENEKFFNNPKEYPLTYPNILF